jgi:6-phosphogluconate dehydrogenase
MTTEHIGFIGTGLMGHGMAKNIVEKGYPLTVTAHRNRAPVDDLLTSGARLRPASKTSPPAPPSSSSPSPAPPKWPRPSRR